MTTYLLLALLAQAAPAGPSKPELKPVDQDLASTPEPKGEIPAAASIHARKKVSPDLRNVEGKLVGPGRDVLADDMVDEIVDEFAADVARLGAANVGPILIERIRVSDNINPSYSAVLESRLVAAMSRAASVAVVRCVECTSTRSRVDNGEWIVSRGITTREDAQAIARKYGARSFLDVSLNVREDPASMGMDIEMIRAQDASIAFAETYRFDGLQGMLYRGADTAQSREEKLKQLEARLNQKPMWGGEMELGWMWILGGTSSIGGAVGRLQLVEQFGEDRQYHAGISGGGFLNTSVLQGAMVSAVLQGRLGRDSLVLPKFWLGMDAGIFITNGASAFLAGASLKWIAIQRFELRVAVRYLGRLAVPGSTETYGGGVAPEVGVGFVWN